MKTSISMFLTLFLAATVSCTKTRAADVPPPPARAVMAPPILAQADVPPPTPSQEEPEVLTRGPVNEAYAEPVNMDNQAGLTVQNEPPPVIEEAPPLERPAGDQFVWIPGYWAWDQDRNNYIWVSGCWRAAPPSMYWVPGYWARTPSGWQWVAGFWSPSANTELEYLPPPPALTDAELAPPEVVPGPDRMWVPPCWYWRYGQYTRRPGYWIAAQADWVWVPSHYIWSPRGYIFVGGHWDYSLRNRGVLFAPVYFPRHHYRGRYALSITVDTGNFEFSLFTYPRYCHYYFGDYYDTTYVSFGIYPWFECERRHGWYDPIYYHDRWRHHREHHDWYDYHRREYDRRRDDRDLRPPRTYREMEKRMSKLPEDRRRSIEMARPMSAVVKSKTNLKFEQIKPADRDRIEKRSTEVHKFGEDRSKWESQGKQQGRQVIERRGEEQRGEKGEVQRGERGEAQRGEARPQGREAAPGQQRKEVSPGQGQERRESAPGQERREVAPGQERKAEDRNRPETRQQERKAPETKPEARPEQKPSEGQSEKVKVPNPPVGGKQGGMFRQNPPSQPKEEQKATEAPKEKSQPKNDNRDNQKGSDNRNKRDRG